MSRNSIVLATLSLGLLYGAFGCSDEEGSTVSDRPTGSAGTKTSGGGSGSSGGSAPKAGSSSTAGAAGTVGVISSEACPGLPIEPVEQTPAAGGAPSAAGGAANDAG